jgi:hypothetical protein
MVEESRRATQAVRTRQALDALNEKTRVQRIKSMTLSGIQGKPMGSLALNGCSKRCQIISCAEGGGVDGEG